MSKKRIETLVDEKNLEKIVRSRKFERPSPNPTILQNPHQKFFIFRWPGDEIEGILGPKIVNYRRNSSYTLKQQDGSLLEFFGNKYLHKIIDDNELIGSFVRIEYIGYEHVSHCRRPRKIYAVYKIT